jgi:hypothetical protein
MLMRMGGKRTLIHCWWECKLVQPLWKSAWRVILMYDPAILLLGIGDQA